MELSFVLVMTLVTLVTATPHGYGVKGGAAAKAEASAVAGAIAPIPLSIPSGAGYSGSFSKSSSSSFASSSASSSASSYSFSGSGANGIAGIGDIGSAQKGCSTGACPGNGATGQPLNGLQQFSGSNAVATAQANALAGSYGPCQGPNCNISPTEGCSSGHCPKDSDSEDQKDCTTGKCQKKPETPSSETGLPTECSSGQCDEEKEDSDSNDFAVNINRNSQSKQNHDVSGQYSNKDKPLGPDCSNGKCGPSYPGNLANKQNQQPVPATYLTAPNLNEPCTSPNCYYPSQSNGPQTGSLPSSYNVPIQSATNPPNTLYSPPGNNFEPGNHATPNNGNRPDASCTSPSCNSGSNIGSANLPNNQESSNQGPCLTGRCDINPSIGAKPSNYGAAPGNISPNYGNYPSNTPTGYSGQSGCRTPGCSELPKNQLNRGFSTEPKYTIPTYSTLPSNLQSNNCGGTGCAGTSPTGTPAKVSHTDAPVYSGGFGGPAGVLDVTPGGNKVPGHFGQPNHYSPTNTPGFIGHSPHEVTNPNELGSINHYGPTHTASTSSPIGPFGSSPLHGSYGAHTPEIGGTYNKPSSLPSVPSTQFSPSHGGSFGVPSASNTPLGSVTYPGTNYIHKPSSTVSTGNVHGFTDSTGLSHSNSGSNAIHGSFGVSKPSPTSSVQTSPTYTGGFGGPTGTIDSSISTPGPSGTFKPGSGNCGLGDCNGKTDANINVGTTSYDKTKLSADTSSQKKPTYTGGFGGPTGILKPNEFNIPANIPSTSSGISPCTSGNCGPCTSGNCGPRGTPSGSQSHGNSLTGAQSFAAATANANAVAYSGGFGGPPGIFKPYDDGKLNNPAHGNLGSGHSPTNDATPQGTKIDHQSDNGKKSLPGSSISGANSGAVASASASAGARSYNGNENFKNNNGESGGCNSGCHLQGSNNDDAHIGYPNGFLKNGEGAGSVASAKSVAGANSFGLGGSFASSSASAHASAGAGVKGGYGKK